MIKNILVKSFPSLARMVKEWMFVLKTYGRKPELIVLNDGLKLYADWNEPRGRALIMGGAMGQLNIKSFWKKAAQFLKPDVLLDVGANYGEVLFCTSYDPHTKLIVGVEANPYLFKFLNKSYDVHPNNDKIMLLNNLASDNSDIIQKFYIDKKSSGRSTALKNNFVKQSIEVDVESIRLDDYILNNISNINNLVFKIDVEGYEPFVLNGMKKLMTSGVNMLGCIEFNLTSIKNNNIDIDRYFHFVNKYFKTGILHHNGDIELLINLDEGVLKEKIRNKYTETDLIIFTQGINIDSFISFSNEK